MRGRMLPKVSILDPRLTISEPIQASVHIPYTELPYRVHELPPKGQHLMVADFGDESLAALEWLGSNGRQPSLTADFTFGDDGLARLWAPNAFLESCLGQIPHGKALDIACGSGRDAVYMASGNWNVTAIDHLPDAISLGQDLEQRYLESQLPIEWICGDLSRVSLQDRWDLITCFFFLNRTVLANALESLVPGGHFIVETFTSVHREMFGKPRSPDFVLLPGELRAMAEGLEILEYEEAMHGNRHTAQIWAKRPG